MTLDAVDAVDLVDTAVSPLRRRPSDVDFDSFREVKETKKLEINNEHQRRFVSPKDFVSGVFFLFCLWLESSQFSLRIFVMCVFFFLLLLVAIEINRNFSK